MHNNDTYKAELTKASKASMLRVKNEQGKWVEPQPFKGNTPFQDRQEGKAFQDANGDYWQRVQQARNNGKSNGGISF